MLQKLKIGLILPAIPGYSETFIINKINGLVEHGYKVSLFVYSSINPNTIPESIPTYCQIDITKKFHLFSSLITILIKYPVQCVYFLYLERVSSRSWIDSLKNLVINSHIFGKSLDWIHFGFATTGIGKENLAQALGIKVAVSFRGYDIGLYPHQHPGCYNLLWQKIDKVHTISDDLYQRALKLGLDPKTPIQKITPAIDTVFFKSTTNVNLRTPIRILTIGRLVWKKGFEYALQTLSLLKKKQINSY